MTISRIGMQTHVYVCIFLMWTSNHANIILWVYVRFTFKWKVDCCWCMDCILIMWGNRFTDYRHDVCQVQKKNYHCFGLEKPGCYIHLSPADLPPTEQPHFPAGHIRIGPRLFHRHQPQQVYPHQPQPASTKTNPGAALNTAAPTIPATGSRGEQGKTQKQICSETDLEERKEGREHI